jgi:threonine/homoserine/homoserine lactone efflux protein
MSYLSLFMWSFGVALAATMSPGPLSMAVVTEGARRGFRAGPLISTGHVLMELLMVGALALGMGHVLDRPILAAALGVLGGLFLLRMGGIMAWKAARRQLKMPQADEGPQAAEGGNLIGLGIAATVGNPFWYLWWIGVGGGYVLMAQQQGLIALTFFYVGHILADYAWNALTALLVVSGRRWFTDGIYQALLLACGLFLVYTGVRFIWVGVDLVAG